MEMDQWMESAACVKSFIHCAQGKNFLFDKRQEQIPEKKPSEETEKEAMGDGGIFQGSFGTCPRLACLVLRG